MDSIKGIVVDVDFKRDMWHRFVVYYKGKEIDSLWILHDALDYIGNDKRLVKRLKELSMV